MALPPTDPVPPPERADHERIVQEVHAPGEVYQRQVVHDQAMERYQRINRITQIIWLFFMLVEALIGIRIVLALIGANPAAAFTQFIYGASMVFLWPFTGITANPSFGAFTLELSSIIAMIVYLLLAWGITKLIWVLFYRANTSAETVYRQDRF